MHPSTDKNTDHIDRERLLELYGDDTEMLLSSIEMFLDEVLPIFLELQNQIELQDWEAVTTLTHQLRPWLGMVGLTTMENKLWEIEKQAKKNPVREIMLNSYSNFNADLEQVIPVLKVELPRNN